MKRFWAMLLCMLLPCSALAQEAGAFETLKQQAWAQGMGIETKISFDLGTLPGMTEEKSQAIESVLDALEITLFSSGTGENFLRVLDVFLQETSVMDCAVEKKDGVYYEQSSLLAGQTVMFSPEDWKRLAEKAAADGGVDASDVSASLARVMEEAGNPEKDFWQSIKGEFSFQEVETPELMLPGVGGASAQGIEMQREAVLALLLTLCGIENETAEESESEADEETLLFEPAQPLLELSQMLQEALPDPLKIAYTRVLDEKGDEVCRHLVVETGEESVLIEWTQTDDHIGALYAQGTGEKGRLELLLTWQKNEDLSNPKKTVREKTAIMQATFENQNGDVYFLQADLQGQGKGDERKKEMQWLLSAEAFLNETLLGGIDMEAEEEIRNSGTDGKRTMLADLYLTGLSEKRQKILSVSMTSQVEKAEATLSAQENVVNLSSMSDAEVGNWLEEVKTYFPQAALSMLALLPEEAAVYLLGQIN